MLRKELSLFDIHTVLVEPALMKTRLPLSFLSLSYSLLFLLKALIENTQEQLLRTFRAADEDVRKEWERDRFFILSVLLFFFIPALAQFRGRGQKQH